MAGIVDVLPGVPVASVVRAHTGQAAFGSVIPFYDPLP
jgi:hypothetical protein